MVYIVVYIYDIGMLETVGGAQILFSSISDDMKSRLGATCIKLKYSLVIWVTFTLVK